MPKTSIVNVTTLALAYISHGARDRFNRLIGSCIKTYECDFVEAPPEVHTYYVIAPGHYFALRVQATRNEEPYGPIQSTRYFKTLEERNRAGGKYIHSAWKRAQKREGK